MLLLYIFISLVFVIAGIMRLIYREENKKERKLLYPFLPYGEYVVAVAEILLGLLLLTKYRRTSSYVLVVGIVLYTLLVFISQWYNIRNTFKTICTYNGTAKSVVLHIAYIVILMYLIMSDK